MDLDPRDREVLGLEIVRLVSAVSKLDGVGDRLFVTDHERGDKVLCGERSRKFVHARLACELAQAAKREGTAETFMDVVRQQPLRVLLILVAVLILLGLVALPAVLLRG